MLDELTYVAIIAASVSCLHTITGPDHYLPFIALSRSKNWSLRKTITWTLLCGLGHVGSSLLLGLGGIALGWSLSSIRLSENMRGGIASWAMLVTGTIYLVYALIQLRRNNLHKHFEYDTEDIYVYEHRHNHAVYPKQKQKVTPWVMFIIFLLGPCEPLIPLLSFPAANHSVSGILTLIIVFTLCTLLVMVGMVVLGFYGLSFFNSPKVAKYMHVMAGSTIMVCGAGMVFLDW